jgi:hypothetical protein
MKKKVYYITLAGKDKNENNNKNKISQQKYIELINLLKFIPFDNYVRKNTYLIIDDVNQL